MGAPALRIFLAKASSVSGVSRTGSKPSKCGRKCLISQSCISFICPDYCGKLKELRHFPDLWYCKPEECTAVGFLQEVKIKSIKTSRKLYKGSDEFIIFDVVYVTDSTIACGAVTVELRAQLLILICDCFYALTRLHAYLCHRMLDQHMFNEVSLLILPLSSPPRTIVPDPYLCAIPSKYTSRPVVAIRVP
ncbi:hypothetical protein BC939DRAFT_497898 [Gamsiella multidivaricata]|uniref:uncharacterized protein n=1 Tax=Gamsiella multidivaricata TaxID=101098 RepID=UPI00221EEE06|nr:uncharacterized protein BC939DRAFT_497898 [Gamsiella multidivaricata]KAI7815776.1 hypothetical protein BC939DRAFT_497898 [Gamsiella multidivaricata]